MEIARMASPKDAITGADFAKLKELKKLQAKNKKFMA